MIRPEYAFHKLNKEGQEKAIAIAQKFTDFTEWLDSVATVPCREKSIMMTKLEEASFFAKKAMAINLTNQEHPEA